MKIENEPQTHTVSSKVVNQYGDHSISIGTVNNATFYVTGSNDPSKNDENGRPYVPLDRARYDSTTRIIQIGNEKIKLPIELTPIETLANDELPYINALCEVYSEKLNKIITSSTIDQLPTEYNHHLQRQREAYYSAESVHRSVQEVFPDGENQFIALKDDAYNGIDTTYYSDVYKSGYERLQAVLEKITNTTLSKSALMNIVGLIGNLEKKGICHILVNDNTIKSWVSIDG